MPYFTRPDFSRQIKQYSGTTAILSGATNILEKFSIKNIEIDTKGALDGNVLIYDFANNKFVASTVGSFGSGIVQGLILTYNSGLTYDISSGSYKIGATLYEGYLGGSVTIQSGKTGGSRFDVVYITSAVTAYVKSGITTTNPTIPALSGGELQIGIIFVPANFTGGTGSTIIQTTADTTFQYYNAGTGIQRSPSSTGAEAPGAFSFALGSQAKSYGDYSVALGYYTRASGTSQTVVGQYNTENTEDYFQVGNGVSDGSRNNAFRVTSGGSAYVQNKLFVSGIEIQTSSATNGQALVYDGTKFKPQNVSGGTGGSGTTSGYSLGNGVKVLFSSDTTSLSFATLSSQTPSLSIVSSSTGVIVFSSLPIQTSKILGSTNGVISLDNDYLFNKITITAATSTVTITSITANTSITSYTPSIIFFADTGVTVTFRNSTNLKTEGGLDGVISGSTYDSITFTYNNDIKKYFQTNINNYI